MNPQLLREEVQEYLQMHESTPLEKFIFKGSPFTDITIQELAQQLDGRRRIKTKLPLWYDTNEILFPPKLNLEQTSSVLTAKYKASLAQGETLLDMTGGFGIDSYYFAQVIKQVTHVEMNEELSAFAKANFQTLKALNIKAVTGNSIEYLQNHSCHFDTIYIDPARRDTHKGKVFKLADCVPNVPEHLDVLVKKSSRIVVKTSPLLDITVGLSELRNVSQIHIVAVKNEVKELVWILDSTPTDIVKCAAVNLDHTTNEKTIFNLQEALQTDAQYSLPETYLYEPHAALMKSGAFNWTSSHFDVFKLHQHTHLYTSLHLVDFPGRRFVIDNILPFDKKLKNTLASEKANITTRNFKLSVSDIRKRLRIKEGGNIYLFFTTDLNNKQIVLVCKKL